MLHEGGIEIDKCQPKYGFIGFWPEAATVWHTSGPCRILNRSAQTSARLDIRRACTAARATKVRSLLSLIHI